MKRPLTIVGICGSLQAGSSNLALLREVATLMPVDTNFTVFQGLAEIPHFNPDHEAAGAPAVVIGFRAMLQAADGVIIASPEYGFSLPGSLKNAIDWTIGTGELAGKPIAVTASVAGVGRGRRGLQALLVTLDAVGAVVVGGDPIVRGPEARSELDALIALFIEVIDQQTSDV